MRIPTWCKYNSSFQFVLQQLEFAFFGALTPVGASFVFYGEVEMKKVGKYEIVALVLMFFKYIAKIAAGLFNFFLCFLGVMLFVNEVYPPRVWMILSSALLYCLKAFKKGMSRI